MKIFANKKIRSISIVLTIIHALALMFTPGGSWSSNPKEIGFWIAIFSAVTSTIVLNVVFLKFPDKG
ncbi:hypothetical protein [Dyadobacter diqingensis]|uniref:hypothetical protein n=1 Tax=Dyadobacter diqingensis TaxID=2938121 RepID=UPI0020C1AF0E|nr:hypothetical protein [Dyadobacter diqingensis]